MAMHPRYSGHGNAGQGSPWYFPAMIAAAVVLGAVFFRRWSSIGVGLVVPQLLVAGWTTPRGDNDGLWVLIFPMLVVLGIVLYGGAGLASKVPRRLHPGRPTQ